MKSYLKVLPLMLLLTACKTVEFKNYEFCGDMGPFGASCFNTLKSDIRRIEKEAWDKERVGMVCTTTDAIADQKANIEELCHQTGTCTYEQIDEQIKKLEAMKDQFLTLR